jgi:hypothetical protein
MSTLPPSLLIPFIIFIVSGAAIIAIVGVKMYQQASGAVLPLTVGRNTLEAKMKQARKKGRTQMERFAGVIRLKTAVSLFDAFRSATSHFVRTLKTAITAPEHWLDRHTRSLVSLIRGRQESQLKQRGKPSDFMRKIGTTTPPSATSSKTGKKSV